MSCILDAQERSAPGFDRGVCEDDVSLRGGFLKVSASLGDGLSKAASSAFHDDEVLPFELHVLEVALGEASGAEVLFWLAGMDIRMLL